MNPFNEMCPRSFLCGNMSYLAMMAVASLIPTWALSWEEARKPAKASVLMRTFWSSLTAKGGGGFGCLGLKPIAMLDLRLEEGVEATISGRGLIEK